MSQVAEEVTEKLQERAILTALAIFVAFCVFMMGRSYERSSRELPALVVRPQRVEVIIRVEGAVPVSVESKDQP